MSEEATTEELTVEEALPEGYIRIKTTVNHEDTQYKASFPFDTKTSLAALGEEYGEDIVKDRAVRGIKLEAQSTMRGLIVGGKTPEEAAEIMMRDWRPGKSVVDPVALLQKQLKGLTKDEKRARLTEILGALEEEE